MSTPVERLIDAAESMTPDEIHQYPMAAHDKLRALARELRIIRARVVAEEPEWEYGVRRRHGVDEYPDEHTARWWIGRKGQDGERQWLLRRRPGSAPGEWVPVKQEGAEQ